MAIGKGKQKEKKEKSFKKAHEQVAAKGSSKISTVRARRRPHQCTRFYPGSASSSPEKEARHNGRNNWRIQLILKFIYKSQGLRIGQTILRKNRADL